MDELEDFVSQFDLSGMVPPGKQPDKRKLKKAIKRTKGLVGKEMPRFKYTELALGELGEGTNINLKKKKKIQETTVSLKPRDILVKTNTPLLIIDATNAGETRSLRGCTPTDRLKKKGFMSANVSAIYTDSKASDKSGKGNDNVEYKEEMTHKKNDALLAELSKDIVRDIEKFSFDMLSVKERNKKRLSMLEKLGGLAPLKEKLTIVEHVEKQNEEYTENFAKMQELRNLGMYDSFAKIQFKQMSNKMSAEKRNTKKHKPAKAGQSLDNMGGIARFAKDGVLKITHAKGVATRISRANKDKA